MKQLSLDYVGGFFDADGSVGIYRRNNTGWQVCVAIANSGHHGRIICNQLCERFGGTVTTAKAKKETHRDVFWWRSNGKGVVGNFLREIEDHSIIKKDQITACILFIDEWEKMPRHKKTNKQKEWLQKMADDVKMMKRTC